MYSSDVCNPQAVDTKEQDRPFLATSLLLAGGLEKCRAVIFNYVKDTWTPDGKLYHGIKVNSYLHFNFCYFGSLSLVVKSKS